MSLTRRPGPPRPRRLAVLLAVGAVLAGLAVLAVAGHPARAAAPGRPGATVPAATAVLAAYSAPAPAVVQAGRAAVSRPGAPPAEALSLPGLGGCGLLDFSCDVGNAITGWFASLVRSAVNPLLALIGQTALTTPQPGSVPAVQALWGTSLGVADGCYALLVLIGGIIVMSHETLQTSYSAKEIAPRVVLGFIGANLSMVLMSHAVDLANGLSAAFTGGGVDPKTAAQSLVGTLGNSISNGGIFLVLLALAGVVLALVLALVYVIRLMAVVLLAAAAPVCLALYALPQTSWAARWWWRALTAALAVQVAQGLVLTAAVQVFFAPGWLAWAGAGSLGQLLVTLCLLWIVMRIPFWIARPVLTPFGRSPLRKAVRFAVTAAILSRVAPLLRPAAGARRKPAARTAGRRTAGTAGSAGAGRTSAPGAADGGWRWTAEQAPRPAPRTAPGTVPPGRRAALPPAAPPPPPSSGPGGSRPPSGS